MIIVVQDLRATGVVRRVPLVRLRFSHGIAFRFYLILVVVGCIFGLRSGVCWVLVLSGVCLSLYVCLSVCLSVPLSLSPSCLSSLSLGSGDFIQ